MQRPTDNLRADHAITTRGLAVLSAMGQHVQRGGDFPVDDCALLLRFLREFLLAVHFRKEGEVVGPTVAMRADDRAAAVVGELLRMQDEVAELVHTLVLFWEPVGDLTAAERTGFAETVANLSARLQRMQRIEEQDLFATCDATVPADDQLDWVRDFAAFEACRTTRRDWTQRVEALAQNWLS